MDGMVPVRAEAFEHAFAGAIEIFSDVRCGSSPRNRQPTQSDHRGLFRTVVRI